MSTREFSVALIQSFSLMAYGSSLMHGSHTYLGNTLDTRSIAIMSYITHQASVENLRVLGGASVVVTDLNSTREVFNSPISHLKLHFSVAICCNC